MIMATVLVIDDSHGMLALLEQFLANAGHRVLTASDGKRGIEILKTSPVDLVVTDMYMPEQDGMEVIQEARKVRPGVPIIVMSSKQGRLNMFNAARALGAAITLQKPFSAPDLIEAVNTLLNRVKAPAVSAPEENRSGLPDASSLGTSSHHESRNVSGDDSVGRRRDY
jgi:DNA-binding NtrC family response regulator